MMEMTVVHPEPDARSNNSDKESLIHDVYWHNQKVDSRNIIIGKSTDKNGPEWESSTDFTSSILKNLKIGFRSKLNGASDGKYVSLWTWQTVDSIR